MMFGNVAPAPLIFTWADAGTASARAARARSGCLVIGDTSSSLEVELSLEIELGPHGLLSRVGRAREAQVVPIEQQPPVGCHLVRGTADDAGLLVIHAGLRVRDVDPRDQSGLAVGELVHAEGAVHVAVHREGTNRPVLRDRRLTCQGDLTALVGHHADEPVALGATVGLAVLRITG